MRPVENLFVLKGVIPRVGESAHRFWLIDHYPKLTQKQQTIMKKKIILFVLFLLVSCVSGHFLVNFESVVHMLLFFLSTLLVSYLLYKALPINYRKDDEDE